MKDLILCMAILLSSFIVKGQSSDESAVLTYKVITMQEIGGGNVSPKQKVYKNKYVVVTPKLFVVSNTKNNWDAVTSETVAKVIDVNFHEELGTLMIHLMALYISLKRMCFIFKTSIKQTPLHTTLKG